MPDTKAYSKSKTLWFGACQVVIGVIGVLTGAIEQETANTLITTGILSIILRFKTNKPLGPRTIFN